MKSITLKCYMSVANLKLENKEQIWEDQLTSWQTN